jgi:hypothetical protein
MTIYYLNGKDIEAVLLSRTEQTMRIAVEGAEDAMELTNHGGTWVSDQCDPVSIRFEWQRNDPEPEVSEDDFHCPREFAAGLIHSLFELNVPRQPESSLCALAC